GSSEGSGGPADSPPAGTSAGSGGTAARPSRPPPPRRVAKCHLKPASGVAVNLGQPGRGKLPQPAPCRWPIAPQRNREEVPFRCRPCVAEAPAAKQGEALLTDRHEQSSHTQHSIE